MSVQNSISGNLRSNTDVNAIQGNSRITVKLVTDGGIVALRRTLGRFDLEVDGSGLNFPIPFKVFFDPKRITQSHLYALTVEVRTNEGEGREGKLLWVAEARKNSVLTMGAKKDNVNVYLEPR